MRLLAAASLALLALLVAPFDASRAQATPPARPKLIVFLTVDQMREDYLDRWSTQFTGGLARLSQHGVFFTNAFQDHAVTETAPGHSVTMSGRFPRSTGIVRNSAGVGDAKSPLLTSRDAGASPYRFRGTVLMDWLTSHDSRSRGLSISRKDRGAILPFGRAKESVFWYATSNGEFTTSRYYADTLPSWIRAVNARRTPQRLAGHAWNLLLPESAYAEPDSQPVESFGEAFLFPHVLSPDTVVAGSTFPQTPWMDELTLAAALEGVRALSLGSGAATDLLAVSLSATDYIGHRYGPDSREQHDNILHLDRSLGAFIDSLYKLRDSSTIIFALTADHGVTSYPEVVAERKKASIQPRYDIWPAIAQMRASLREINVDTTAISVDGPLVWVDKSAFKSDKQAEEIVSQLARALKRTPGIARVDTPAELARKDTLRDPVTRRWLHMIPPDAPVALVYTPDEGAYPEGVTVAEHGMPYDDDAHVPVVFYGPWFTTGKFAERALVVDMAPTLARVAGVSPAEPLDGHVLTAALKRAAP